MNDDTPPEKKPTFSTAVILVLLLSIYAWLGTILVFFIGNHGNWRLIALAISLVSSGLVRLVGREQIAEARRQGGQIRLSGIQSVLVTLMVVAIGALLPWGYSSRRDVVDVSRFISNESNRKGEETGTIPVSKFFDREVSSSAE